MALPNKIDPASPPGTQDRSLGDDRIRELKQAIIDILGLPSNTNVSSALLEVLAAGLQSVILQDRGADPTATGSLARVGKNLIFHGGERAIDIAPTGAVVGWPVATAPTGWLLLDGAAISRTTFAALFALIGTTYGIGDGSTTFNLPNAKGRVLVGLDAAQVEFDVLAEVGGAKTHQLLQAELPAITLTHPLTDPGHIHQEQAADGNADNPAGMNVRVSAGVNPIDTIARATLLVSTVTTNPLNTLSAATGVTIPNHSIGSGSVHNNLQPYLVLNYIIKT